MLYSIYIDNDGDGRPEIEYAFRFKTTVANQKTFLYNTGPITSLDSANWNRKQTYSVTRIDGSDVTLWGTGARSVHDDGAGHGSALPAVQHRVPLDA